MKHSNIILPLLAAVALSSCNKQAATDAILPEDRIIRVETSVDPDTKGSYTSDNLDEFVLFVRNETASLEGKESYNYKVVFKRVNGDWTPQGGVLPLWRKAEDIIHMIAIAPPSVLGDNVTYDHFGWRDGVIASVQSDQTKDDNGSDIIGWSKYGEAWRFLENEYGKVKIDFSHLMSKLSLSFELATEFNAQSIPANNIVSNVIISGAYNQASIISGQNDICANPCASDSDIKAYNTNWTSAGTKDDKCISEWECILVPKVDPITITITFDVNGVAYSCNVTHGFESGCNHKLKIIVGSDVAYPSGMSISAWTNGGSSNLETE